MLSSDDSASERPRHSPGPRSPTKVNSSRNRNAIRPIRRHKRFGSKSFSTDTLGTLPEYQAVDRSSSRDTGTQDEGEELTDAVAWDGDEIPPPPGYPGSLTYASDILSAEEADEERDVVQQPLPTRPRKPRRRKSFSGTSTGDRLDLLLERSILALETSNALLQSSLATHSSLSNVLALADNETALDRSVDAQIRFLSNRLGADEEREAGLDHVLKDVVGLLSNTSDHQSGFQNGFSGHALGLAHDDVGGHHSREGSGSRSLPVESHMERVREMQHGQQNEARTPPIIQVPESQHQKRLRLSADGRRPRSPPPRPFTQYVSIESPQGHAFESTATGTSIYLPSTSGIRTAPHTTPITTTNLATSSPTPSPSETTAPKHKRRPPTLPVSPLAHAMLSRIASSSSSLTASSSSRSMSPSTSRTNISESTPSSPKNFYVFQSGSASGASSAAGTIRSHQQTSSIGSLGSFTQALIGSTRRPDDEEPSLSSNSRRDSVTSYGSEQDVSEVGRPKPLPPSSFAIAASLRKILADADREKEKEVQLLSEVAAGKRRAEGERPDFPAMRGRSSSASTSLRPPALQAITTRSISRPIVYRGERSAYDNVLEPPTPFVTAEEQGIAPDTTLPAPSRILVKSRSAVVLSDSNFSRSSAPPTPTTPSNTQTPRRSALKLSGRSTPNVAANGSTSSGHSSPRIVSFSPLPPKHETDGTFQRAKDKANVVLKDRGRKEGVEEKEEKEQRGWWSEWLLGSTVGEFGGNRPPQAFTPVSRTGSLMREELRWGGGMESWQI